MSLYFHVIDADYYSVTSKCAINNLDLHVIKICGVSCVLELIEYRLGSACFIIAGAANVLFTYKFKT